MGRRKQICLIAAGIVFMLGLLAGNAQASTITLSNAQIKLGQGFVTDKWAPSNSVGGSTVQGHLQGSNQFKVLFDPTFDAPPAAIASWTLDLGSDIAATAGDIFALDFLNSNGNTWDFQLSVLAVGGGTVDSSFIAIDVNNRSQLSVVLAAGTTYIDKVTLRVRGDVPLGPWHDDRTANFNIYAVPEPTSILLLVMGAGLITLAGIRRKERLFPSPPGRSLRGR